MLVTDAADYPRYYRAADYGTRHYVVTSPTAHPKYADQHTEGPVRSWFAMESYLLSQYRAAGSPLEQVSLASVLLHAPHLVAQAKKEQHVSD